MDRKYQIIIGVLAVFAVFLVIFWHAYPQSVPPIIKKTILELPLPGAVKQKIIQAPVPPTIEKITAFHRFKDGVHSLLGTVVLPNPCYKLTYKVEPTPKQPEEVMLSFMAKDSDGVCVQTLDDRAFEISFKASENVVISARVNGQDVPFILNNDVKQAN